ncbi:MAG: DUF1629 domain-containing protein [Bacteroidota bacterium]
MENYYLLSGKNSPQVPSASAPKATKLDHELIPELDGKNEIPFELNLVKLSVGKNGLIENDTLAILNELWLDYLPNSLAWPLMSEGLKNIFNDFLTGNEGIDWLIANVNGGNKRKKYYVPRFNKQLDVLDIDNTLFVENTDHVIRPCFSLSKIKNLTVFHKPTNDDLCKITPGLYINEALKKAIQKEKLTGMVFSKTRVSI